MTLYSPYIAVIFVIQTDTISLIDTYPSLNELVRIGCSGHLWTRETIDRFALEWSELLTLITVPNKSPAYNLVHSTFRVGIVQSQKYSLSIEYNERIVNILLKDETLDDILDRYNDKISLFLVHIDNYSIMDDWIRRHLCNDPYLYIGCIISIPTLFKDIWNQSKTLDPHSTFLIPLQSWQEHLCNIESYPLLWILYGYGMTRSDDIQTLDPKEILTKGGWQGIALDDILVDMAYKLGHMSKYGA